MKRILAILTVMASLLVGGAFVEVANAPVAAAQSCTWQNFWTQGGVYEVTYNISYSTCPGGSHQIVCDLHYYGTYSPHMGGCNFWVVWSIGISNIQFGNYWNGTPAHLYICANGGGIGAPCWGDHKLVNLHPANPGWHETWPGNQNTFGVSDEWGHVSAFNTQGSTPYTIEVLW